MFADRSIDDGFLYYLVVYQDFANLLEGFVNCLESWSDRLAGGELADESPDAWVADIAANDAMSGFIRA